MGRLASASPNVGVEYNLDSITAVVLGGTSLFGGRGLVLGTLVGALIVGVFRNGLQLAGVDVVWQGFAIGLLVLVAVSHRPVDQEGEGMTDHRRLAGEGTRARPPSREPVLQAKGLVKRYGPVTAIAEQRPGALPRRDPRRDRRQRRRQVQPDQGAVRGAHPGQRRDPAGRQAGALPEPDGRPAWPGIETVYQSLAVAPGLDIADNLFLGREERKPGILGSVFRMLDTQAHARARPSGT